MRSRERGEIRVAQLQVHCASVQAVLAQPSARHLRKARQRSFERRHVSGILVKSVLVADGFRVTTLANLLVEPAAGIFAVRFAGQRQSPLAETFFQIGCAARCQFANRENAELVQVALRHFADTRNPAHPERRNDPRLHPGHNVEHAIGLGQIAHHFRN